MDLDLTETLSAASQVAALREGCALIEQSWRSPVELTGEDRLRFLNGQVTADVGELLPGQGVYGFVTTQKGRVLSDFIALAMAERIWLEVPSEQAEAVVDQLSKYIIADRVEPRLLEDRVSFGLAGPEAEGVLERLGMASVPRSAGSHESATLLGVETVVQRWGSAPLGAATEGFTLWLPTEEASAWAKALGEEVSDVEPVGSEAFETVRGENGRPRFGVDFDDGNLPQETGLESAVSYTKGCYLGQEIVARLHYRGQVSRQIRQLEISGTEPPEAGTALLFAGRPAGTLTSVAKGATGDPRGKILALGMIQRRAFEPGTVLQVAPLEPCEAGDEETPTEAEVLALCSE